jgi:hypothetical protein
MATRDGVSILACTLCVERRFAIVVAADESRSA